MNLDDLMEVWRSQDAAPLHGVNQTLLHLALRKEQAKLQAVRRRERWIIYLTSAGLVAAMMVFLAVMISTRERHDLTGWDFAVGIVAAAAALLVVRAIYMNHRAESRLEQSFGRSLRDQLNRSIAQLEHEAARARRTSLLVLVLMGGICPAAILLLGWRVNGKSISDDGYLLVTLLIVCAWTVAIGAWQLRRSVQNDILPRKRRLEALLQEFDGQ